MNRLQLATLLSWASDNGIQGRKRLQKVVFFLQQAGCPLDCHFTLHHFGPYSRDVADICDEMVAAGLIVEEGGPQAAAMQYSYALKPQTRAILDRTSDAQMSPFQNLGARLIGEKLWSLELGSTILYFYRQGGDWSVAMREACKFKNVPVENSRSAEAFELAQQIATGIATE